MKALVSALALLSFVAATTVPTVVFAQDATSTSAKKTTKHKATKPSTTEKSTDKKKND